ncbi:fatty acid hydroxylase [Rudanella paleaurantiibacter]|uniref:Fatty acid hydroxylase n=1 Tax=Rudanella paleaurantiibacter TaxID=2614655 RepID=A0A7J5TXD3_9BACT|nr:sterol desaturase family protein [Rudanella paleaurantiibacter]KAB7729298.1 fatty acid hydroxylase [Rudanella paleaurantiibacter]
MQAKIDDFRPGYHARPKNNGTKQLFDNPILEALSRTHIMVPISMWLVSSVVLMWYAFTYTDMSNSAIGGLFVGGFFIFTLFEYILHRFLYHLEPKTPQRAKIQYTFHGVHHEYPKDKTRLAMPPALAIFMWLAFFGFFFLIMGEASYAFFPGFLVGYSGYLAIHFIVHAYAPPKNFFKWLWINHSIHHYKNEDSNYGVSSPLWDHIFGTYQK